MLYLKEKILDSESIGNAKIEVVQMQKYIPESQFVDMQQYPSDFFKQYQQFKQLETLFDGNNCNTKFIRITLDNGRATAEPGALYYSKGNIKMEVQKQAGEGGTIGKMFKAGASGESAFVPTYTGCGEIVLEPSNQFFVLIQLNNEGFIVDKGAYYCSIGDIEISSVSQKNFSTAMVGGEGEFQTKVRGTGWVALKLPIPIEELKVYQLNGESMMVDGNFTILRSESIDFSIGGATTGFKGNATSGEGMVQKLSGSGMVWLAPTLAMRGHFTGDARRNLGATN